MVKAQEKQRESVRERETRKLCKRWFIWAFFFFFRISESSCNAVIIYEMCERYCTHLHAHTLHSLDLDVLLQAGPLPGLACVQIATSASVV